MQRLRLKADGRIVELRDGGEFPLAPATALAAPERAGPLPAVRDLRRRALGAFAHGVVEDDLGQLWIEEAERNLPGGVCLMTTVTEFQSHVPLPAVRRIGFADLRIALDLGLADFREIWPGISIEKLEWAPWAGQSV